LLTSNYSFRINKPQFCRVLCVQTLGANEMETLAGVIKDGYRLPLQLTARIPLVERAVSGKALGVGMRLGQARGDDQVELFNHVRFTVQLSEASRDAQNSSIVRYKVVGFDAVMMSYAQAADGDGRAGEKVKTCAEQLQRPDVQPMLLGGTTAKGVQKNAVVYSYDVVFEQVRSQNAVASQVDAIRTMLAVPDALIAEQKSALTRAMILLIACWIAMVVGMGSVLRKDMRTHVANAMAAVETVLAGSAVDEIGLSTAQPSEGGWKLVRNDVFTPPFAHRTLITLAASGAQILAVIPAVAVTRALQSLTHNKKHILSFKDLAFDSLLPGSTKKLSAEGWTPSSAGGDFGVIVGWWLVFSVLGGLANVRMQLGFGHNAHWRTAGVINVLVPAALLWAGVCVMNALHAASQWYFSWPLVETFLCACGWLALAAPLALLGGELGAATRRREYVVRSNTPPRHIPKQSWYKGTPLVLAAGALPFTVLSTHLKVAIVVVSEQYLYREYAIMLAVALVSVAACATVSVGVVYIKLVAEDYRWFWPAFMASASTAVYSFLYAATIALMAYSAPANAVDDAIHVFNILTILGHALLASAITSLGCGSIGLFSAWHFVRRIYWVVRAD